MPPAVIIAGVAAAASIGTGIASTVQQASAAKEQRRAAIYQRQRSDLEAAQQKRAAQREGMAAYAQAQQTAENQGVGDSSGAQGGQGSIISQTDSNVSFLDNYSFLTDQASKASTAANKDMASASMWNAIGQLTVKAANAAGGFVGPSPSSGSSPQLNYDMTGIGP